MASLVLSGDTSGSITVSAPAVAGSTTQTLVNVTGTLAPIVSGTAVASTSGTSIDFTGIPSWVKRITVMFQGVSTNGTSNIQIQIGSGSFETTGYVSTATNLANTSLGSAAASTGFLLSAANAAANVKNGAIVLNLLGSNIWTSGGALSEAVASTQQSVSSGTKTISGTLDRVRITTVNGTDTFDAGTINLLWE